VILNQWGAPLRGYQNRWGWGGGVYSLEKHIQYYNSYLGKKKMFLLLSYYRFYSKFTIALICFSRGISFVLKFQIKLLGKTDLKGGGGEIFMFTKGGMG
jgi:hypothetical protein